MTTASTIAATPIFLAVVIGYLVHRAAVREKQRRREAILALPMYDACAVILNEQLLPEVDAYLAAVSES